MLKIPEKYQEAYTKLTDLFQQPGTKTIITDRGLGKSKNAVLWILEQVVSQGGDYAFLMRNWGDDNQKTKEYFKKVVDDFCLMWVGQEVKRKDFEIKDFETYYFGLLYKGKVRVYFYTLFDEGGSRGKHDVGAKCMFVDEAIPTRAEIKKNDGGWQPDEPYKFSEHEKSIRRNNLTIEKVFLGNPNTSFYEIWFCLTHWKKELEELGKWYWTNRPKNDQEWRKWTWIKIFEKDGRILYLEKLEGEETEFSSYEEGNWDNFFVGKEKLKIVEPINGSRPLYVFNDCLLYLAKRGFWYFIRQNDKRISNKEDLKYLKEIVINEASRRKSQQRIKQEWSKEDLRSDLLRKYELGKLFFADSQVKQSIETFIDKGKLELNLYRSDMEVDIDISIIII